METLSSPHHLVLEPVVTEPEEMRVDGARLRNADRDDVAALVELENAFPDQDRVSARNWRDLIRRGTTVRIAEFGDDVVGALCLLTRKDSRVCRIYSLAVSPQVRGRGFGSLLLHDAIKIAAARGCDRLRLEVRVDNLPANRLYEAAGFDELGIKPGYYDDGTDARHMELNLPGAQRAAS